MTPLGLGIAGPGGDERPVLRFGAARSALEGGPCGNTACGWRNGECFSFACPRKREPMPTAHANDFGDDAVRQFQARDLGYRGPTFVVLDEDGGFVQLTVEAFELERKKRQSRRAVRLLHQREREFAERWPNLVTQAYAGRGNRVAVAVRPGGCQCDGCRRLRLAGCPADAVIVDDIAVAAKSDPALLDRQSAVLRGWFEQRSREYADAIFLGGLKV